MGMVWFSPRCLDVIPPSSQGFRLKVGGSSISHISMNVEYQNKNVGRGPSEEHVMWI